MFSSLRFFKRSWRSSWPTKPVEPVRRIVWGWGGVKGRGAIVKGNGEAEDLVLVLGLMEARCSNSGESSRAGFVVNLVKEWITRIKVKVRGRRRSNAIERR